MRTTIDPTGKSLTICFVVLVSLTAFARVNAATLVDYRHRVSEAVTLIEQLQAAYDHQDPSRREQSVITTAASVRADLPAKETVSFNSESVLVDNTWLHEALQDYEKSGEAQSREALARIQERLRAVKERLDEIQPGSAADERDKDGDKGKLAEILRRPDYNKPPTAEGSAIERLWERFMRWFAGLFRPTRPIAPGGSRLVSGVAQVIVVAVCLAAIALVIWKFGPRFLGNRGRKKQKREARIVLGERLEPDQTAADLLAQAEGLARHGDLRGAIRKAYIALLCELGDRKIVSLAQHKTNRDYLNSIRGRAQLYSSVRRLTNSFELHWYGFQPPVENDWNEFRSGYQKALEGGSGP